MHIKAQTVIPPGTKITKCAPSNGMTAKSVYSLERAHERKLEQAAELAKQAKNFIVILKAGFSVEEALVIVKKGR